MKVQEKNTAKVKITYSATKVKARIFLRDLKIFHLLLMYIRFL